MNNLTPQNNDKFRVIRTVVIGVSVALAVVGFRENIADALNPVVACAEGISDKYFGEDRSPVSVPVTTVRKFSKGDKVESQTHYSLTTN